MIQEKQIKYPSYFRNERARNWIEQIAALCKPDSVYFCDGSQQEYDRLCEQMVQNGTFRRLDPIKRPNSFLALS